MQGGPATLNSRVRGMRWTAFAVGASFLCMLFILVSMGVAWRSVKDDGVETETQATLLFYLRRNTAIYKSAGDPAFAVLFIGGIFHLLGLNALYTRWAGRTSRIPHGAIACVALFGLSTVFTLVSFCVYSGKINKHRPDPIGHFGPGFGMAAYLFVAEFISTWALWKARHEIDNAEATPAEDAGLPYTESGRSQHPLHPQNFKVRWGKAKVHSTVIGIAGLNLLFLIMSLGLPWYEVDGRASYGLLQNFTRLSKSLSLRKAGDPAFAFTFFAFIAQIHSTYAITLRFLGRDDGFSGRIPHSLQACLMSTGISCFSSFLSWVIYAGVYNSKKEEGSKGMFMGGFALNIIVWILTAASLAILVLKKKEVDDAPVRFGEEIPPTAFPTTKPALGMSPPAPVPSIYAPSPGAPQTLYTANTHAYAADYPSQPITGDAVAPIVAEPKVEHHNPIGYDNRSA